MFIVYPIFVKSKAIAQYMYVYHTAYQIMVVSSMNTVLLGNDIPPIPMGGYDYDQLDQSVSNQDTAGPHYYDPVANNTSQQQQQIKQS